MAPENQKAADAVFPHGIEKDATHAIVSQLLRRLLRSKINLGERTPCIVFKRTGLDFEGRADG